MSTGLHLHPSCFLLISFGFNSIVTTHAEKYITARGRIPVKLSLSFVVKDLDSGASELNMRKRYFYNVISICTRASDTTLKRTSSKSNNDC